MNTTVFDLLPDDKLFEICEQMDDLSLTRFGQAYSRAYNVCGSIVKQRKEIRLAEKLGKRHQSIPYHIFHQIIDKGLNLANIIKNLDSLDSYTFISDATVNDELLYPEFNHPNPDPISIEFPEAPEVISERLDFPRGRSVPLTDDEKAFFDVFIKFMIQPTAHVVGVNLDHSIRIITIPFNTDAGGFVFKSDNGWFADYLYSYFNDYENIMKNYL